MALSIDPYNLDSSKDVILRLAAEFLMSLKDNTVYKCLFVGVTPDGEVKSSTEGGFFVSRHTRPEYIFMKIRGGVTQFAFRYKGIHFDSYSLAYKEWLLAKDIGDKMGDLVKVMDRMSHAEESKMDPEWVRTNLDTQIPHLNLANYNR